MRPVSLGLIGAGRWGRNYIRTLAGLDGVRLAALASRNPDSAALIPPDCRLLAEWRDVLSLDDLDGVIIATPPATHAAIAGAAIMAGRPVLIEKPLTLNLAEARDLAVLATQRRILAMVDHTHLFHPAFEALLALAPHMGALHTITSRAGNRGPYRSDAGVLWDWGAHDVAMILALAGDPITAQAQCLARETLVEGEASLWRMRLKFTDGLEAVAEVGTLVDKTRRFQADFASGSLIYDDLAPAKLMRHPPHRPDLAEQVRIDAQAPLARAVACFAGAIGARETSHPSLDLGCRVVSVLETMHRHTASG